MTNPTKTKPEKLTPAEAMQRALQDARFIVSHRAKLAMKREEALDRLIDSGGSPDAAAESLAAVEVQVTYADDAIVAARSRLERLGPAVAAHLQALCDQLREVQRDAFELVRAHVQEAIAAGPGRTGWWTQAELLPLVTRSLPMKEWNFFEAGHPASIGVSLTFEQDPETGATVDTLHPETILNPSQLISSHARLVENIAASQARLDGLKREFARSRK